MFFGGDDTFNSTNGGGVTLDLRGLGGNDVFNINGRWSSRYSIDGGNGTDTLNLFSAPDFSDLSNGTNFNVHNIETINLFAGSSYEISAPNDLVASGATLTVWTAAGCASLLSMPNLDYLTFTVNGPSNGTFSGNLVLLGGAGNDFFEGGKGTNIFDGGGGTNTVSFSTGNLLITSSNGVTADLSNTGAAIDRRAEGGADHQYL